MREGHDRVAAAAGGAAARMADETPRRADAFAVAYLCLLLVARVSDVLTAGARSQVPFTFALFVLPVLYAVPGTRRVALAAGRQHGYGIIFDVARISDGRVRLRAGTLYSALDRLRIDGLVEVDREEMVEGRLRRYYRLTPAGTKQLATEAKRVQANAATAFARLGLTRG
jgi:DNA-binding MarR family transcriptional regulator